jgi:hypothetical protein
MMQPLSSPVFLYGGEAAAQKKKRGRSILYILKEAKGCQPLPAVIAGERSGADRNPESCPAVLLAAI